MEKTKLGTVLSLNAGWSDIGSWGALWQTGDKDKNGNVTKGKVNVTLPKDQDYNTLDLNTALTLIKNKKPKKKFKRK